MKISAQQISNSISGPLAEQTAPIPATPLSPALPVRIVIAEDSAISRIMLERLLNKLGFQPQIATDGPSAWKALEAEDVPTIAILDWMMPGLEGVEICRRLRGLSRQHYTYTMLLSSKAEKKEVIEGLHAGADDYITKPMNVEELRARLVVALRIIRFQEELFAAREVLRNKACTDYLTQILNREAIMEALEQELNRSKRTGEAFSVFLVDIDHFKQINDSFGHLTGDDVLFEVANRIRTCMRSYDSVGRYGGEEFLIVVPGCDQSQAFQVGEKIRKAVCDSPIRASHLNQKVTISVGVCTRTNQVHSDELLSSADSALYLAKKTGRNRTEVFGNVE